MRRDVLPVLGVTGVGLALGLLAVLLSGTTSVAGPLLALAALIAVLAEVLLERSPRVARSLESAQVGATVRAGARDALLVGFAASWLRDDRSAFLVVAGAVGLVWLLRGGTEVLRHDTVLRREVRVSWRNLDVPAAGVSRPLAPRLLARRDVALSVVLLVLSVIAAARELGAPDAVLWTGAAVAVAVAAGLAALAALDALRVRREPGPERLASLVGERLAALEAEVVLYYSRPEAIGYIANVWMPVLEQLDRSVVVIAREQYNADLVETSTIPVVCVTNATDIERVVPPSVRLAMYPSNVAKNNHLIRMPGIVDVFIGHGDSDKGGSATTLTRIFDEAWVSGPAARERYHVEQVGVRDDQIREIGRPQLAEIERVVAREAVADEPVLEDVPDDVTTVLYAPTREGFFATWQYSSILAQGATILESLLAMPRVRVLFKPHPGTGTDDPAFGAEVERLLALVRAAGEPHEVVESTEGLYTAFNRADVLVSDISSVITDFLASGKPYVVTDPSDGDVDEFRAAFPSAAGAWVLAGDGSGVVEAVEDARGPDRHASERARTAVHLLGESTADPVARFDAAIDEAVVAVAERQRLTSEEASAAGRP
ncbi:CDP-glycerol glycerophosphotransferase family protein [Phycicoccus sonneratiae]|uniref:CDP-glycerol glycerophosphotransferase family protein n=1 Tax=Phycicoccus sonneratiae TaxID=2807628 RepID=A0ABS2CM77_9MICO|nr:CDP-glycerol glycerophosphotransferase family protein [Phycicoccus sonneraticus]MBM6400986.1 CDP-glycerol glycerophosphotransferase family protein [Phycicoccus sonneraticus]